MKISYNITIKTLYQYAIALGSLEKEKFSKLEFEVDSLLEM